MGLFWLEPIQLSYHPAKFDGPWGTFSGGFWFVTWCWSGDVITNCLISLIWVNSSICTSSPNLVVIGRIEIEISIIWSILSWILQKKLNLPPQSASTTSIPIYNCQVLGTTGRKTRKRTQANVNCYVFYTSPKTVFSKMQATVILIALHSK